jgi:hypothetical protein
VNFTRVIIAKIPFIVGERLQSDWRDKAEEYLGLFSDSDHGPRKQGATGFLSKIHQSPDDSQSARDRISPVHTIFSTPTGLVFFVCVPKRATVFPIRPFAGPLLFRD